MRFDGSATTTSNGVGVVLSCEDGDTIPSSFKLGFSYSNNAAEYEAYLIGLAIALSIGVKHMRVLGDSNLVVSQVKGDFALREQSLTAYKTWAQEQEFLTFSIEYTQRSENRFADALATLGSQGIGSPAQEARSQILLAKRDPIQKGIQWGSLKMPGAQGSQESSQGSPFQ
nr:uncharacterized protein LOC111984827 [Quercus suber]